MSDHDKIQTQLTIVECSP